MADVPWDSLQVQSDGTSGVWSSEDAMPWNVGLSGGVDIAWLNSYDRKDGSLGHRLLVSAHDHSLRLLQATKDSGKAGWVREEALATVAQAEFLHLPSPKIDVVRGMDHATCTPRFKHCHLSVAIAGEDRKGVFLKRVAGRGCWHSKSPHICNVHLEERPPTSLYRHIRHTAGANPARVDSTRLATSHVLHLLEMQCSSDAHLSLRITR